MAKKSNRRKFLAAIGGSSLTLAAGCTGQLPDTAGDEDEDENNEDNGLNGNSDSENATPPAINHGEVVSNFDDDLDDWFELDGELTGDDEVLLTGSQSARIENTGGFAGIARSFPDGLDMESHHLSMAVRVDTPRPARITVRIHAPGQADQVWGTRTVLSNYAGWLRMDVGYTGGRGEPLFDNVQEIEIVLDDPNASTDDAEEVEEDDAAGELDEEDDDSLALTFTPLQTDDDGEGEDEGNADIQFWVDDLRITPAADQGYVMLTFDDAVESQYENVFSLLEERDIPAVAAVVPDSLNRENRLTIDHLREMRDAGWDISSHPEGEAFRELEDPDAIRQDIESAHAYLDNRGFPGGARSMFVPYHNTNEEVVEITREYHELSSYFGGSTNAVPFTDPMHLSRVNMFDLDAFTSMIDSAAEYNQLAIGLAHGVVPEDELEDDPLADMSTEQLEELLDYIEESDVQVVTASDLLDNSENL
ncbi:polysaccharide deacetylase family protein [Halalkalicoccus tibetensis]|uniref:Polysaccharide deacetylase family protein n=1 Tax=Halalkalicoccus tibetensis TaxID=175632 RepID=A0ABD5V4X4_9EURY